MSEHRLFKRWEITGLALLVIACCVGITVLTVRADLQFAEQKFVNNVRQYEREILQRFGAADAVLTSLAGINSGSNSLPEYERRALSKRLLNAYPYIQFVAGLDAYRNVVSNIGDADEAKSYSSSAKEHQVRLEIASIEPVIPPFLMGLGCRTTRPF